MDVKITVVEQATPELAAGLSTLLPQLLSHEHSVSVEHLDELIKQPGVKLFVAMIGDKVVGTAQLSIYARLYDAIGWVDGVVVDSEERGKGIATTLMQAVIDAARAAGIGELNLTSNPKREAANHLYQKLGFEQYNTNYHRLKF